MQQQVSIFNALYLEIFYYMLDMMPIDILLKFSATCQFLMILSEKPRRLMLRDINQRLRNSIPGHFISTRRCISNGLFVFFLNAIGEKYIEKCARHFSSKFYLRKLFCQHFAEELLAHNITHFKIFLRRSGWYAGLGQSVYGDRAIEEWHNNQIQIDHDHYFSKMPVYYDFPAWFNRFPNFKECAPAITCFGGELSFNF